MNPVLGCHYQACGQLPSQRASPPFGWYQIILLGDRGTCTWTTCPELLPGGGAAGNRTRDLSIASLTSTRLHTSVCVSDNSLVLW